MGHFEKGRLTGEQRREIVIDSLTGGNATTNILAHAIWPDWRGPRGKGSHPLCRPTGKILSLMKKAGIIEEVYNTFRKRHEWKLIQK